MNPLFVEVICINNLLYEQASLFKRQCKNKNIKELSLAAL
ncbi:hypothetical protein Btaycd_009600 [Bartonella taylorii]|nr:hypothetical protein Btaycd_009600 [Bartonella taylorii]